MRAIWCRLVGHDLIRVREIGVFAQPGGMLPSLDGMVGYKPDPTGSSQACRRCRSVVTP